MNKLVKDKMVWTNWNEQNSTDKMVLIIINQSIPLTLTIRFFHIFRFHLDLFRFPLCVYHLFWTFGYNSIELKSIQSFCRYYLFNTYLSVYHFPVIFCPYHFIHTILSNTIVSVYHFARTILSYQSIRYTILSGHRLWLLLYYVVR